MNLGANFKPIGGISPKKNKCSILNRKKISQFHESSS